jgi:hypothetical protein
VAGDRWPNDTPTAHAAPDGTVGTGPYPRLSLGDVAIVDGTGASACGPTSSSKAIGS